MASRDFLGRFGREGGASGEKAGSAAGRESDEIELSLGLSLGGCFGTDPVGDAKKPRLVRSSSIASICSLPGADRNDLAAVAPPPAELMRTTSLPTEPDEERWRRRDMQSQRRLAAKRKRLERRNSMNSGRSAGRDEAAEATYPTGIQLRRSVSAQGSTSSSSLPEQGSAGGADAKSSSAMNTSSDNNTSGGGQTSSLPPTGSTGRPPNGTMREQPPLRTLRSLTMSTASTGDLRKSMMEDMPMVSSRVDGPNTRKIDGFLYKYNKGEQVRIVCVCHGNFLTPAEFVKHAGGGDVANPLRHIVVNPQASVFL